MQLEQWCIYRGKHLMTFADNHDVTRLASILTNKRHIPFAYGLCSVCRVFPVFITEANGKEGTKSPDNDYAFKALFRCASPNDLTDLIRRLIALRRKRCAVQRFLSKYRYYKSSAYFRAQNRKEQFLVAVNASDCEFTAGHHKVKRHHMNRSFPENRNDHKRQGHFRTGT